MVNPRDLCSRLAEEVDSDVSSYGASCSSVRFIGFKSGHSESCQYKVVLSGSVPFTKRAACKRAAILALCNVFDDYYPDGEYWIDMDNCEIVL